MAEKIEYKTESYNERRYGKPWIARVDFSQKAGGEFIWGTWVGDIGKEGVLVLEANEGDIVARGQKDFRNPKYSAPIWYQVVGVYLVKLSGKARAYELATTHALAERA